MKIGDKEKKEIVQRYLSGESKNSIAKSFNVSHTTISKILNSEKVSKSFNFENMTMLAFLESKRPEVQELMNKLISACGDKITKASLRDCTTATVSITATGYRAGSANITSANTKKDSHSVSVSLTAS